MTSDFDPSQHPRGEAGKFAVKPIDEADVDLYADVSEADPFAWAQVAQSALDNYDAVPPGEDPDVDDVETMRESLAAALASGAWKDPNWGTARTRNWWASKAHGALQWMNETSVDEDYDVDTMADMTESLRQVLARANPKTHPTARTADGKPIVEGMVVLTNDMKPGTVNLDRITSEGWFDVDHPGGGRSLMNGERISTTFRNWDGKVEYAEDAYDVENS